jgi:ribonucleoside-diphosphate reductase alpha chain
MAAVQPFISGAISKTVNMPEHSTAADIAQVYIDGWKLGLKAIAVYRDNSKRSQPLSTKNEGTQGAAVNQAAVATAAAAPTAPAPYRRRLPDERSAFTHKFNVAGHEGYLTVGLYEDGQPGEIFLRISKEGSTVAGMMEAFAIAVSVALQYGVPLKDLVNKFSHTRFEPAGFTTNPDIPMAKSLIDYIFRYLATKFLSRDEQDVVGVVNRQMSLSEAPVVAGEAALETPDASGFATEAGAPPAGQLSDVSRPERGDQTLGQSTAALPVGEELEGSGSGEIEGEVEQHNGLLDGLKIVAQAREERLNVGQPTVIFDTADSPSCSECGSIMVRNGSCYKCINCGATSGCS